MDEGTPFVPLHFMPTIRMCPECYIELKIVRQVGLTVSRCVLRFNDATPQTLTLRAVPTAGANSRIVALKFRVVTNNESIWQGYSQTDIRVCYFV